MSIETISPTLFSIGSGGVVGFLIGFAIKKVMKILAVLAGVFFAALMYLQSQGIINVNWDKLQTVSQSLLTVLGNSLTETSQISTIAGNLGIPLTGGLADWPCSRTSQRLKSEFILQLSCLALFHRRTKENMTLNISSQN